MSILSPRLAEALRRRGYDATSSQEMGIVHYPDDQQLAIAVSAQRAILTFDVSDFTQLHLDYLQQGMEHWGIVLSDQLPLPVLLRRLLRLLAARSADDLRNQILWLNTFK